MFKYIVCTWGGSSSPKDEPALQQQDALSRGYADSQGWRYSPGAYMAWSGAELEHSRVQNVTRTLAVGSAQVVVFAKVPYAEGGEQVLERFFEDIYRHGGMIAVAAEGRLYRTLAEWQAAALQRPKPSQALQGLLPEPDYGYTLKKEMHGGVALDVSAPLDEEVRVLTEFVIPEFLAGTSRTAIARALNEQGVPTRTGRRWNAASVAQVLERVWRYAGEPFEYVQSVNGVQHAMSYRYPAIIDGGTARKVAEELVIGTARQPTPFSGVLLCGTCGSPGSVLSKRRTSNGEGWVYQLGCSTHTANRYFEKTGHRDKVQPTVCTATLVHGVFVRVLEEYLLDMNALHRHMLRFMDGVYELDARVTELKGKERGFLTERQMLREKVAALTGETDWSVARTRHVRLSWVDEALDATSKELVSLQRELDWRLNKVWLLGINFGKVRNFQPQVRYKLRGQFNRIDHKALQLLQSLKSKRDMWDWVSRVMEELGLVLVADFGETDLQKRQESVRVELRQDAASPHLARDSSASRG